MTFGRTIITMRESARRKNNERYKRNETTAMQSRPHLEGWTQDDVSHGEWNGHMGLHLQQEEERVPSSETQTTTSMSVHTQTHERNKAQRN